MEMTEDQKQKYKREREDSDTLWKSATKTINKLVKVFPDGLPNTPSEKADMAMVALLSKPEPDREDLMIIRAFKASKEEQRQRDIRWENKTGEYTKPDMRLEIARWDSNFWPRLKKYKDIIPDKNGIYYHFTDIDNEDTDNSGGLLGLIISKDKKTAFVQIYLEPDYRRIGLIYPLLVLFSNLHKLNKVEATISKSNTASIKASRKIGFKEIESQRRDYLIEKGLLQKDQRRFVKEFNRSDIEILDKPGNQILLKNHSLRIYEIYQKNKVKVLETHEFKSLRGLVGYIPPAEFKKGDYIG